MKLILGGVTLDTKQLTPVGIGGEAEVFRTPQGTVLKVYKGKNHIDYQGNLHEQKGADIRIQTHQKKLPLFPKGLPGTVVAPLRLAYDDKKIIRGYEMKFLENTEVLAAYAQPNIITARVTGSMILELFKEMHRTVTGLHANKVVIGDFNDLNIMIEGHTKPWFIDADSYQFAGFDCTTFDERFVDPTYCILAKPATHPALCADGRSHIVLAKRHSELSDWYAFTTMLFQTLLLVGPYGGVYRPAQNGAPITPHHLRPLEKISAFHKDVIYPKKARPYGILPDDLLHYFSKVFEQEVRQVFPSTLLENTRFTTCTKCGMIHARATCPTCNTFSSEHMVTQKIRGNVTAEKLFTTSGVILKVITEHDGLKILTYENGSYMRENKRVVKTAPFENMKYRISGHKTIMGKDKAVEIWKRDGTLEKVFVDVAFNIPSFDANSEHIVWAQEGRLYRDKTLLGSIAPEPIGDVLKDQTMFWTGTDHGFGFYRAGDIQRFFLFDPNTRKGILDSISIPPIRGRMIDATCAFSSKAIWFFVSTVEGSERKNRAYLVSPEGKLIGTAEAIVDDGTWLGTIRGKLALGLMLFAATDEGLARIELVGDRLVATKTFPDTAEFVDSSTELFAGTGCIIVNRGKTLWKLTMK